jgi:steroid 5-alpha reductase family enzyme
MSDQLTWFLVNLALALGTSALWLTGAFATSRLVHRHAVVDVFWGSGFLVVYLESLLVSSIASSHAGSPWWHLNASGASVRWVALVAVAVWSLRLTGYLAWRQRGQGEDSRYVMILRGAKGRNETLYALRTIYLLQAGLLWFVSIPLQWIAFAPSSHAALMWAGAAVVAVGVGFESVGDGQLRRFLADPANRGTTMDRGLWRYTRHPNYFGDAVVWWGLFLLAASTGWGALSVLSPLAMNRLLTSVSGKPLLEAKLTRTRQGYAEYVARTSAFLPPPPRRDVDA